jgi:RimJ/RimL family protein N-acetyltransferase
MAGKHILETERLQLREFDEDDAAAFYVLGSDPSITRYTGDAGLADIEHARQILRTHPIADYHTHGFGRWACILKASGALIGFAGLKYLVELNEVDLGYRLLPAHWGHGLATEASRASVEYGFAHLGLERIIGLVDTENVASVRVLEKLGMTFTGLVEFRGQSVARYELEATAVRLPRSAEG